MKSISWMQQTSLYLFFGFIFLFTSCLDAAQAASLPLVINEFMASNQATIQDDHGDFDDWIELYNASDQTVDAGGLYLTDNLSDPGQWAIPMGTIIPAFGHLVLWADNQPTQGPLHTNFRLKASGEQIGLFDTAKNLVDSIKFGPQTVDTSYGRSPDGSDTWRLLSQPSPGTANSLGSGGVLINEIMYHPYQDRAAGQPENTGAEYVELYNSGSTSVDLTGWSLHGGVHLVFPATTLAAGAYVVAAADPNVFARRYPGVTAVVGPWSGHLSNRGESLSLKNAQGQTVNQVTYSDQGDWSVRQLGPTDHGHRGWEWSNASDGGGRSLELINPAFANDTGQNWAASTVDGGTPGGINSVAAPDIAPVIEQVKQTPLIPGPADPVAVRALVIDDQNDAVMVSVFYRVDKKQTNFSETAMFDDGQHGDDRAGDHVYGAWIPGQADKDVVEFYVQAVDAGKLSRTWPAPVSVDGDLQQTANALYQVDASFHPNATRQPGSEPVYHLIMTDKDLTELNYIESHSNDAYSGAHMNGTFISVDGTGISLRYQVGIRNRGQGSRTNSGGSYRNNYRVCFLHDHPWHGITDLNIKDRYGYSQVLGAAIFRRASLAAADTTRIQVRVNGENLALSNNHMYGSYVAVEVFDSDFTAHQFPDDSAGNVYRTLNNRSDLAYKGTDPANYRSRYHKETNSSAEDFNDLIGLTDALNNAPTEDYVNQVSQVLNLHQWMRYLAVDCLAGNKEGGLTTPKGDDYAMYRGVHDPRFLLVPYDLDTLFGLGDSSADIHRNIHVYAGLNGLHELLTNPDVLPLYHQQLLELMNTIFSPEQFDPMVDQVLGDWVPQSVINNIKAFERQRCAAVLEQIPREMTIQSNLPRISGYLFTTADSVNLFGTADTASVHSMTVAGRTASWSPFDDQWNSADGSTISDVLINAGSSWSYLDNGSDQGTAWQTLSFDDSHWANGRAQLGYGDGDEVTQVSYGPDSHNKYITTYFRHVFNVTDPASIISLKLQLLADDGAVVYLNGMEVARQNMPSGAISYRTHAVTALGGTDEQTSKDLTVTSTALQSGSNVLAVEIHQASGTSSDISFDLSLSAVRSTGRNGTLTPGINRVTVTGFDGPDGSGQVVQQGYVDVWNDSGSTQDAVSPTQDTTWTAAQGPYHITGELVVPAGVTLTIEPGTSVFFDSDARLTVHGCLVAEGTAHSLIRFTRPPGSSGIWTGVQFKDTQEDNRIGYAVLEYGRTNDGMVGLDNANLTLDHVTFDHTDLRRIRTMNSSLVVRHCMFTDFFGPDQAPTTDNFSEDIWGSGVPVRGRFIIEDNRFGTTKGHNDIIDFDGATRPNAIPQILNNTFLGGGDEALDLECDAHIEGNRFMDFNKDAYDMASGESNAISAGHGQHYVVVRNVFSHCQYAIQVKDNAFLTFVNNTVIDVNEAVIYFDLGLPGRTPGRGAELDGDIFWHSPQVLVGISNTTDLTVNHSLLPAQWSSWGVGNIEADPLFVDDPNDLHLRPNSPARGSGPWGLDMGAMVPAGAAIAGVPPAVTSQPNATLTIGGPGIIQYQYSLNSDQGPWSNPINVESPLDLTGLTDGQTTQVYVLGQNSAGVWQNDPAASPAWTVDRSLTPLRLNEILAVNDTAQVYQQGFPDLIELVYNGTTPLNLTGVHLRKDPNGPVRFTFGAGVEMQPDSYYVLPADDAHGFTLDRHGDSLYLYDRNDHLLDSVTFGPQIPDLSVGRIGPQGHWGLTVPTLGQANQAALLSDVRAVRINEWLASEDQWPQGDFVELYNPQTLPVDVSGLTLTDLAHAPRASQQIGPLSFIPAQGTAVWIADNRTDPGHLGLKLSANGEHLALLDRDQQVIDMVDFGPQTPDVSEGRIPDGSDTLGFLDPPTPDSLNSGGTGGSKTVGR